MLVRNGSHLHCFYLKGGADEFGKLVAAVGQSLLLNRCPGATEAEIEDYLAGRRRVFSSRTYLKKREPR